MSSQAAVAGAETAAPASSPSVVPRRGRLAAGTAWFLGPTFVGWLQSGVVRQPFGSSAWSDNPVVSTAKLR